MSRPTAPISIVKGRKEQSKLFLLDPPSPSGAVIYTVAPPGGLKIKHIRNGGTGIFTDIVETTSVYCSMTVL